MKEIVVLDSGKKCLPANDNKTIIIFSVKVIIRFMAIRYALYRNKYVDPRKSKLKIPYVKF
jgi:hypothetical protein